MRNGRVIRRGRCPACGKTAKLTADGKIGRHPAQGKGRHGNYLACLGVGREPVGITSESKPSMVQASVPQPALQTTQGVHTQKTRVAIVLDRSGSMSSWRHQAAEAFNNLVEPLRQGERQGQQFEVSVYGFGSNVLREQNRVPAQSLPRMSTYGVNMGFTALYDAMGDAIADLSKGLDDQTACLVLVITDGEENASRRHNKRNLASQIRGLQATDRWTFAISCPTYCVASVVSALEIPKGNVQGWDQTSEGAEFLGVVNAQASQSYVATRGTGQRSTQTYFAETLNVGRDGVDDVERKLRKQGADAPAREYRKITAPRSTTIQELVESKGIPYQPGKAYYELLKPERIQDHKQVLLERRESGSRIGPLYRGPAVRDVLGIPQGQEGRIKPGNLGEWIVWVQSTSTNRKLLAKTHVLYDKRP